MSRRLRPRISSLLLLALLVPSCDESVDSEEGSLAGSIAAGDELDELAAPMPASLTELDELADAGLIVRASPESAEQAGRALAERLRVAELRVRAASDERGQRMAAMLAPTPGLARTSDGNYRVKITDAELGEREVVTMGPVSSTLDLAAALDGLDSASNQLAAYRALYDGISPAARARLGAAAPDSLRSAKASEIRRELERLAAHPDLLGSLVVPSDAGPPAPTVDNSGASCTPSAATGVVANYSFPLKTKLSPVKNQGGRGTCSAFSVTSAVETARAVGGGGLPNYSEQDLYYRAKAQWAGLVNYGDGMHIADMVGLAADDEYHFANESSWPYNPSSSRIDVTGFYYLNSCVGYSFSLGGVVSNYCSDTAHQGGHFCAGPVCFYSSPIGTGTGSRIVGSYDVAINLALVKSYLALNKSLVMSFYVTNSFTASTTGYVNSLQFEPSQGTHAIHVVGTIDNAQLAISRPGAPAGGGGGYLILKNSWGSCSGDGGFYYMSYASMASHGYAMRVVEVTN